MESLSPSFRFSYEPLDLTEDTIRLLSILPFASGEAPVTCTIQNTTVATQSYTCLSYTWLPSHPQHDVILNGIPVQIGDNLFQFLKAARRAGRLENLWIDALCINQGDHIEKSHQVHRMGEIYRGAEETLVWLGRLPAQLVCCLETLTALAEE